MSKEERNKCLGVMLYAAVQFGYSDNECRASLFEGAAQLTAQIPSANGMMLSQFLAALAEGCVKEGS